ncbi:MAG: tRNA uridine-5-carboxymethylaminomethyl(34) synthesis GTPase MnmE [Verrucomicrobiota bacterium]
MDRLLKSQQDTIVAIATPPGESGLAIIRVSGDQAFSLVDQCFSPKGRDSRKPSEAASHTIHYGHITEGEQILDEVMVSVFKPPRTFTREPVVEISTHGGSLPVRQVLQRLLGLGARLAQPGEFSMRAFLNGRIDLTQAEAIADLIHARTERAAGAAQEQLRGTLGRRMKTLSQDMMHVLAHVEAHIDFPDEDIAPDTHAALLGRLSQVEQGMQQLLLTAREGKLLRQGLRLAIIGKPNAGKSSLLNCLLGQDRAIVSPMAGTTRDTIEAQANIRGIPVILIDTAGLRDTEDSIEQQGVARSRETASQAELILHILDASLPLDPDESPFEENAIQQPILEILNKVDLPIHASHASRKDTILLSCATGVGIESLKDAILKTVWSGSLPSENSEVMINSRHQHALQQSLEHVAIVKDGLASNRELELIAMDLRIALSELGEVIGETTTEDLLDSIFSQFCLGK